MLWKATPLVLQLGVQIMDLLYTGPNVLNASFIPKILPPHSCCLFLTVKLYPMSIPSNTLAYISFLIWPGLLTSTLFSQNALIVFVLIVGCVVWACRNLFFLLSTISAWAIPIILYCSYILLFLRYRPVGAHLSHAFVKFSSCSI